MSELQPHITFSEGVLSITRPRPEVEDPIVLWRNRGIKFLDPNEVEETRDNSIIALSELTGVTVEPDGSQVHIEIANTVGRDFKTENDPKVLTFLDKISSLLPLSLGEDPVDHVLPILDVTHPTASVTHQFQRWLNRPGLTEEAAKESLKAMALPFGDEALIDEIFDYDNHDGFVCAEAGINYKVMTREETFGVEKYKSFAGMAFERNGKVDWRWLELRTAGSRALYPGIAVDGYRRQRVRYDTGTKNLYLMTAEDVVAPTQSLSILLGLGSLAHNAAAYEGQEDVFADARWQKRPHYYPGDPPLNPSALF